MKGGKNEGYFICVKNKLFSACPNLKRQQVPGENFKFWLHFCCCFYFESSWKCFYSFIFKDTIKTDKN